jgi:hypothetical protein
MADPGHPPTPPDRISAELSALAAALAAGRVAIGAGLMLAPERVLGALGFERASEATIAVARLAGVRDIVLGVAQATATGDRGRLRRSSLACAAADAGDAAVFGSALLRGGSLRRAGARGLAAAGPATLAGLWAAWRLR